MFTSKELKTLLESGNYTNAKLEKDYNGKTKVELTINDATVNVYTETSLAYATVNVRLDSKTLHEIELAAIESAIQGHNVEVDKLNARKDELTKALQEAE